jgi:hypothetical protein
MKGRRSITYTGGYLALRFEQLKQESRFGAIVLADCEPLSLREDLYKSGRRRTTLKVSDGFGQILTYKVVEG